jgi:acyl dehydratase
MEMREIDGDPASPIQYWTIGGIQLMSDPDFAAPPSFDSGWLAHLGIMVEDLDVAITACQQFGAKQLEKGPNWLQLPDGLAIELIQATGNSVAETLAINPRVTKPANTSNLWAVSPATQFETSEKTWDDACDGDVCISPTYVVTEERIKAYAELTGDYTPVHIDEEYAKTTPFGTRVAHGLLGLSIADGLKTQSEYRFLPGMSLGWTWDFLRPIRINDTLYVRFTVTGLRPSRSRPEWGIVILKSELINQHDEVVQNGEHRLMIPRRAK